MQKENKQKKYVAYGIFILIIIVSIGVIITKVNHNREVVYLDENANTGFGNSYMEVKESKPNEIKIDIEGAVRKPGLKTLKNGHDRFDDAIKAAGGYSKYADSSQINLALRVCDGMKIVVPKYGEELIIENGENSTNGKSSANSFVGKINVNTASSEELQKLPGIGPSYAQRIIEYRESYGKFSRPEDLLAIKGIGEKRLAKLKDNITF